MSAADRVLFADVSVLGVHQWWAWVMVVSNGLAGCWALAAHFLEVLRARGLWWFTLAAELAIFVQVILGVFMVAVDGVRPPDLHMFYGFFAIITVAVIYSYRPQIEQHRYLLYGLGGLFIMGLGLREIVTA